MRNDSRTRGVFRSFPAWLGAMLALFSLACGGSGGGTTVTPVSVGGSGVKGPLAGAAVTAFAVDLAALDLKGAVLDTAVTDATAAIVGLELPGNTSGKVLVEFTSVAGTVDITTPGLPPILDTLTTIVDAERILAGAPVYATPISTMAVALAGANAGSGGAFGGNDDGTLTEDELSNALEVAGNQVASTFGFGLLGGMSVFETAPLLNADTDTPEEQADVAAFRTANEALAAVVHAIGEDAVPVVAPGDVLMALAMDLADGVVDGMADGVELDELTAGLEILDEDPSGLMIPGTDILVGDSDQLLADELAVTGVVVADTTDLENGEFTADPAPPETVPDTDSDTVQDDEDNCVTIENELQADFDEDDQGDVCDPDDDNDGVLDGDDAFPMDPDEDTDTDGDEIGDNADPDDDNDDVLDDDDAFPLDPDEDTDTDGDEIGDNADPDDDNDEVLDDDDAFPLDPDEDTDTDGDEIGDNTDTDDDGDGVDDDVDNCPLIANSDQADEDEDDLGDVCDDDSGPPPVTDLSWDEGDWNELDWQ